MGALGSYTLSPTLDGGVFAYHPKRALSRVYSDEAEFLHELQKSDWQDMYMAIANALGSIRKLQLANYYVRNAERAHATCITMTGQYSTLAKDKPIKQGQSLRFMIDMLPLFAATQNKKENAVILDAHVTISDYYDRYLKKYETYTNSYLTA